ncbi:MAG TPA: hypothetical protein VGL58_09015 [Caulobacteraceae bacterium]
MRTSISVAAQFRGPPNSVNGGYACGVMARLIEGPATAVLRAPPPLDTPMVMIRDGEEVRLESEAGEVIGYASPAADVALPPVPAAPSFAAAIAAAPGFPGLSRPFHPICFCCGDKVQEGVGLRVFAGPVSGTDGMVAGPWTPNAVFADAEGLIPAEVVWAALDCPGAVAWVVGGGGGGMLGTMTCELVRRPKAGEPCIVIGWPIERSGRKLISGTALYSADGELMARSHQIWIGRAPVAEGVSAARTAAPAAS